MKRFLRRLLGHEHRFAERRTLSGLVAYYWDGGRPTAHEIRDISLTGMYLLTEDRWYLGTVIRMTLQETANTNVDSDKWIAVQARVVRHGSDGVGLAFIPGKVGGIAEFGTWVP